MVFTNSLSSYYEKLLATGEVKCIDEEIPFEIPKGWEWARIYIFAISQLGKTLDRGKDSGQECPYLCSINVYWNGIDLSKVKKFKLRDDELSRYKLRKGDLLICEGGDYGRCCVWDRDDEMYYQNALHRVRFYCGLLPTFYKYVFELYRNIGYIVGQGQTIKHFTYESMKSIVFPIPPIDEQERIVSQIESIMPIVTKYEKSQEELNQLNNNIHNRLKKSILQEAIQGKLVHQIAEEGTAQELLEQIKIEKKKLVKDGKLKKSALNDSVIFRGDDNKYYEQVGKKCLDITEKIPFETPKNWVWTRLSHIANIYTGNSISETEKKSKFTDVIGRYYIGTKDVDFNNRIIYDNGIAIPKQYEPDFRLAPNNSILMCIEGGSAGRKIAILNQDVCFGNKLCCFSPFVGIGKYMYYYLQSPSFFELFNLNKTGIIGGVSIAKVKEILIPLPPIKERQRIVAQIEKLFEQLR